MHRNNSWHRSTCLAIATATVVAASAIGLTSAHAEATYTEQEGHHGVNTFTNYHNASGMGPRIDPAAYVQVSCKVYDPYIASVNPDGYWYRIASSPWNDQYYSPANTFMNGDPWNGPYTHNTDFNVPDCGSVPNPQPSSPPPPPPQPNPSVGLSRGPGAPAGYWYAISADNFAANASLSVSCRDSKDAGGFRTFTMHTDGSGHASSQSGCYSGDGPDHWVVVNGVESNHVSWASSPPPPGGGTGGTGGGTGGATGGNGGPPPPPTTTSAPPAPASPSFSARRCAGDPTGHIVEALSAAPDEAGYKITIKPGDKGQVPWYADNNKILAATRDMWNIVQPCVASLPLALNDTQTTSIYYQLNCHFWGQRVHSFGGTYDLETWRSASIIPTNNNLQLQLFYIRTRCNWGG